MELLSARVKKNRPYRRLEGIFLGQFPPTKSECSQGKLEEAIADVIGRLGLKKLPLLPSRHTMEMMAKAAVAVYEAAVEEHEHPE